MSLLSLIKLEKIVMSINVVIRSWIKNVIVVNCLKK